MNADFFSRVPMQYRPLIETARALVPGAVKEIIEPRFLIGHSPHFVGLHYSTMRNLGAEYGDIAERNTYEDCAHACLSVHCDRPTVVFPQPLRYRDPVGTVLHEWGHIFDEATKYSLDAPVTTEYSRSNRSERIAEAFETILYPPSGLWDAYVNGEAFRPLRAAMGVCST